MNIERLYFKIPEIFRVIKKNDIDMKFQNANCRLYETNNLEVCKECSTCDEGSNMMRNTQTERYGKNNKQTACDDVFANGVLIIENKRGI